MARTRLLILLVATVSSGCTVPETSRDDIEDAILDVLLKNPRPETDAKASTKTGVPPATETPATPETPPKADGVGEVFVSFRPVTKTNTDETNPNGSSDPLDETQKALNEAQSNAKDPNAKAAIEEASVLVKSQIRERYLQRVQKDLERIDKDIETEHGLLARTQASIGILPDLEAMQPVLIESFSLRNFFQALFPAVDPADIRARVNDDLARYLRNPDAYDAPSVALNDDDQNRVNSTLARIRGDDDLKRIVANEIATRRMSKRYWFSRLDVFSVDFGLASPDLAFEEAQNADQNANAKFKRKVDDSTLQLLVGGGLHFENMALSSGAMVFRDKRDGDLKTSFYVGISIDLFKASLFTGGDSSKK